MGTWILGRAAGVASYTLLLLLVSPAWCSPTPGAATCGLPSPRTRITIHATPVPCFTLVFVVLHLVVLALDPWAKVG